MIGFSDFSGTGTYSVTVRDLNDSNVFSTGSLFSFTVTLITSFLLLCPAIVRIVPSVGSTVIPYSLSSSAPTTFVLPLMTLMAVIPI